MDLIKFVSSLFIVGILFKAFVPMLFSLSIFTGIGFVISCGLSFWNGQVFDDPQIISYIAIGHILTNTAVSQILPMVFDNILGGLFSQALIVGVVFLVVYARGKEIQSGK